MRVGVANQLMERPSTCIAMLTPVLTAIAKPQDSSSTPRVLTTSAKGGFPTERVKGRREE